MKRILIGILIVLLMFPALVMADTGAEIDAFVREHEKDLAGLAVSVFDEKNTLHEGYYGYMNLEEKLPVTKDTVFEWGSCTKLITWVSVMKLYEMGKIDLETDIRSYLKDEAFQKLKPFTMLDLMHHAAGFEENIFGLFNLDVESVPSLEEAVLKVNRQIYDPGEHTAYSNYSTSLAAYTVEQITGIPFADFVHEHVFKPLGMERTALLPDLSDNEYVREKRKELICYAGQKSMGEAIAAIALYPSGMATGTLEDMQRFAQALWRRDSNLLKQETYDLLFTPSLKYADGEPRNYHGFWALSFGENVIGHGGNTMGNSAYILLGEDKGMVLMTNQSNELVFNTQMPEVVFGSFKENPDFDEDITPPRGIYVLARTVLSGPGKFFRYMGLAPVGMVEKVTRFAMKGDTLQTPYMDLVPISWPELIFTAILILFVVVGLVSLIVGAVRLLMNKGPVESKGARTLSYGLIFLFIANLALYIYHFASFVPLWILRVHSIAFLVLGVLMIGMILRNLTKKQATYVSVLLAGLVVFMLHLDLYQFWRI